MAPDQALAWAQRVSADLASHDFGNLIGTSPDDHRPVIHHALGGRRYLYFQKFLRHELEFVQTFRAKLMSPCLDSRLGDADALLREVLDGHPLRLGGRPLVVDQDQRRALELALSRPLVLISGGPGTGKTSIVFTLLRCLVRAGLSPDRIALAAPTGRAAQRLADAIRLGLNTLAPDANSPDARLADIRAVTLHQLLDYVPKGDYFRRHAENPLEAEVAIVDEVSMVGMVLMARLFQALPPHARLVLLGDKDQLPSVDAGAVLANLIPDQPPFDMGAGLGATSAVHEALVVLQTNHRSEPRIRAVAAAINQQRIEVLDNLPILSVPRISETWAHLDGERGVLLLEQVHQTPAELRRMLQHWADYACLASGFRETLAKCMSLSEEDAGPGRLERLNELFRLVEQTRLLTLVREGPWGCVQINHFMDRYLRPRLDRDSRGILFHGAPVLITRNDHGRQLFNGDVGVALRSPDGGLRVVFPRQGSYLSYPADALPAHELGFALTVHKSQGSEYGQVLLVFPPTGGRRLLTKELVYTGITRAKELVILCATRDVLRLAIQKRCTRESGLLAFDEVGDRR
jgi:exodeoxyribonuclease V alpha subunit